MNTASRFRCPTCGFQIYNRRVPKCESCGASLPSSLLLTREQQANLDAEHERNRKDREARAKRDRGTFTRYPSGGGDGYSDGLAGGDSYSGGDCDSGGGDGGGCD